jgi:hypothetical protein
MNDTLSHILRKFNVPLQPDTEHRDNQQRMPIDLPIGRNELASLFAELGFKSGAEIGVEQGEYSEVLARSMPGAKLHLVDAWFAYPGYRDHVSQGKLDVFHYRVEQRMKQFPNVEIHKLWSTHAAKKMDSDSLDFVFIDANHSFDWVIQDLIEWSRAVRPGGIVSGHDFFVGKGNQNHQVPIAVRAYTEAHGITPWFVLRGDHSPTWMWVKQ